MSLNDDIPSRPTTPESPSSLREATATIDDLTLALSDFSRVHSPEPPDLTTCCCGREDCATSEAWCTYKSKIERKLVLSAEVGQALLERHEAYVRRHESNSPSEKSNKSAVPTSERGAPRRIVSSSQVDARVAELVRENAVLEKRLSQALVNSEVTDVTHQKLLSELSEAKATVTRLKTQNVRAIGLDSRLTIMMQEKDDIQQERDSATQRARMAEARVSSLKETCAKLQAQVNRLREDLEMQMSHRQEISQEILNEARERVQQLQHLHLGNLQTVDDIEMGKVLESLVADNELLKRDNGELQNLLSETREDLRTLKEEVDERRADDHVYSRHRHNSSLHSFNSPDSTSQASPSFHPGTAPTPSALHTAFKKAGPSNDKRSASMERPQRRVFEPLTPETDRRPLSPTDSLAHTDIKNTSFSRPISQYTPSHLSFDVDDDVHRDTHSNPQERSRATKSLLLLTRSRGVQTDGTSRTSQLGPSPIPRGFGERASSSPLDGQSDSSSFAPTESQSSTALSVLIERISNLLTKLSQADALTLTNRLKRQRLLGAADVGHLSRTTVNNILQEVATLRTHFRAFLEDDKWFTSCTRKDLRGLFKVFREMFNEMGEMRIVLNDVVLDPSIAPRVSDLVMHPSKAAATNLSATSSSGSGDPTTAGSAPSWIAPFSKFLGIPGPSSPDQDLTITARGRALSPPANRGKPRHSLPIQPPRIVPKREPALSASSMTVNVEFSSGGVGRAIASSTSPNPQRRLPAQPRPASAISPMTPATLSTPNPTVARNVMDIFAGAPRVPAEPSDPWIVIPKPQRPAPSNEAFSVNRRLENLSGSATIGRSGLRGLGLGHSPHGSTRRLSRVVDAIIDQDPEAVFSRTHSGATSPVRSPHGEERDTVAPDTVFARTLRPRGLSDSSIHTTFMSHAEDPPKFPIVITDTSDPSASGIDKKKDRVSVLQTLSRKMSTFRFTSNNPVVSAASVTAAGAISRPQTPVQSTSRQATVPPQPVFSLPPKGKGDVQPETTSVPIHEPKARATSPSNAVTIFSGLNFANWASSALESTTEAVVAPSVIPYQYSGSPVDESYGGRNWARER